MYCYEEMEKVAFLGSLAMAGAKKIFPKLGSLFTKTVNGSKVFSPTKTLGTIGSGWYGYDTLLSRPTKKALSTHVSGQGHWRKNFLP